MRVVNYKGPGIYALYAVDACFDGWNNTPHDCAENIRQLPAADVRPVVMCKNCGHWNKENQHPSKRSRNSVAMCAWFSRNYGTIETSEGDWCSYGYRREES